MALQEFKCPNCGGAIQYNPGTQEMVCPYCESVMDVSAIIDMEEDMQRGEEQEDINWGPAGGEWGEGEQDGMAVYTCQSCSGQIVGDETLGATSCPFCNNPVVMTSKFSGTLRPNMLVPFKLDKDKALKSLQKHYLKKTLLPKAFKDRNHLEEVKGIYVPFWLFDAEADANIEFRATRTRKWADRNYLYSETSFFRVIRAGSIGFSQVPVDGSRSIDDALMESIEPFSMKDNVDFKAAYLAGFFANKYDVDSNESSARANERIRNSTSKEFASTVTGYTTVTPLRSSIRLRSGGVTYALLPVWLLSTRWKDKNFLFAMNGQTGKFVGDLPLDKAAYVSWLLKIFGVSAAALLVISQIIVSFM